MINSDLTKLTLEQVSNAIGADCLSSPRNISDSAFVTLDVMDSLIGTSDLHDLKASDLFTTLHFLHSLARLNHEITVNDVLALNAI